MDLDPGFKNLTIVVNIELAIIFMHRKSIYIQRLPFQTDNKPIMSLKLGYMIVNRLFSTLAMVGSSIISTQEKS
ncbi:hypothetical protein C7972_102355 [Arenibacter sp. ARW7G5Y1]|nr:hypothetical protein C7972_102355 [Arenibacter sp. ARW7G5Y1]|tara:strand:- start:13025 stop:13246 length:222 start_codon:yes stop_codon:yes gene_type:complete